MNLHDIKKLELISSYFSIFFTFVKNIDSNHVNTKQAYKILGAEFLNIQKEFDEHNYKRKIFIIGSLTREKEELFIRK